MKWICFCLLVQALFFPASSFAKATPGANLMKTETYQDIIDKAYALSLQKDRPQALRLITNALRIESKKNSKAVRELSRAFEKIATSFFSDKAQQLFELGISLRQTDPQLSIAKINEALKIEPENLVIQWGLFRLMIQNGDCDSALKQVKKVLQDMPEIEENHLIVAQAALCSGQFETYLFEKANWDEAHSHLKIFWKSAELEYLFKTGAFQKGLVQSALLQETQPAFPEGFYWNWKFLNETKQAPEKQGAKYLNLCKVLSVRQQREYLPEPMVCRRSLEVETSLKKSNNTNL